MDSASRLILEYLPLIQKIAGKFIARLPASLSRDDLVNAGMLAMHYAIENYDSSHGVKIETYAYHKVQGAMLDYLREVDYLSRPMRRQVKRVSAVRQSLERKNQREPTSVELADALGISQDELIHQEANAASYSMGSLVDKENIDIDASDSPEKQPDAELFLKQKILALIVAIDTLPEREGWVIRMRLDKHVTQQDVAAILGITPSAVYLIENRATKRLAIKLRAAGF